MVALLLAALFQSAAPASTVATPPAPPAKTARLACRKETVVGSTIKKKVCPRKLPSEVAQEARTDPAQLAQAPTK